MDQLPFTLFAIGLASLLFVSMVIFFEVGWRVGKRQLAKHGGEGRKGVGVIDGAVYSLLALLIGFTFSGAASRFDTRRQFIIEEVQAIHTAWDRITLLPAEKQEPIRVGFRRYLDAVLLAYDLQPASEQEQQARSEVLRSRKEIWALSVAASTDPSGDGEKARMLLLPGLTEMFNSVESERLGRLIHAPPLIYTMLYLTALATALFAGYALAPDKKRSWLFILGVTGTISVATFVIIDLEYPRVGLIRVDAMDQSLVELRTLME